MALTRELKELACRYAKYAEFARSAPMRDLERSVCGCDYGSTSLTTRREAERIAQLLELRPAAKLLDVGAGKLGVSRGAADFKHAQATNDEHEEHQPPIEIPE